MKKIIFISAMLLASFALQAQDTNVVDNLNLQDVNGSTQGNIYLGGRTIDGNNGMRLFGGGQYNGFIDVVSNSSTDGLRFRVDQSIGSAERMRITALGKVGIGTASPAERLHVKGKIRSSFTGDLNEYVEIYHGGGNGFINTVGDGRLDFRHNNSNKMSLTEAGNLGIGTTAPTQKLHVNGTSNPGIIVGNGTSILTIGSATCNGCFSNLSVVNDKVLKLNGSPNLIFESGAVFGNGRSFNFVSQYVSLLKIRDNGKVSIGNVSTPGNYNLYVDNGILTEKVKVATVNSADWADYVFEEDYDMNSTEEVEAFIKENKHLPNVPSAKEVSDNGVDMVEMDATLLRQIEELWLHVIELKKENEELKTEIAELKQ